MPRFPVTPAVLTELSKYGAARKLTQQEVAQELEPDLLSLFRGEHLRLDPSSPESASEPIKSLRSKALAALEKAW